MNVQLPLPSAVAWPIGLPPPSVRITVAPASAVPAITLPLLGSITGAAGATESTVVLAGPLVLPAASWATALTTVPLASGVPGVKLQLPLPSAVTWPIGLPLPSVRITVAPASAVPAITLPLLGSITGAAGASESTVALVGLLLLPAASWASALITVPLANGVAGVKAQARQRALEAQAHQDLPFEQLVEALQPERNASHNPLFQVLFNHQSEIRSVTPEVQLEDLRLEGLAWDGQTAQFDLTLDIQEDENGIWASFDYATDLFDASTVERLAGHWRNLLRGIVANPRQRLGELPLLDAPERRQTLSEWNPAQREYAVQGTLQQRFEEQARQRPRPLPRLLLETLLQGALHRALALGRVPFGEGLPALRRIQQRQLAEPLSWIGDDAAQQVAPMAGQAFHGGGIEQIGGVVENGAKTLLFVRQVQRQVELRRPAVELHAFHL